MIEELSSTEMAVKLGVSERTVNRWIKDGRLQARLLKNHRYEVDSEHLLRLAVPEHSSAVFDRLTTLEQIVSEQAEELAQLRAELETTRDQIVLLQQRLDHIAPRASRTTPRQAEMPPTEEASSELPDGLVAAVAYGKQHGIPETTVRKAISSGRLPTVKGRWKVGRAIVREALDEQGRERFFDLWPNA